MAIGGREDDISPVWVKCKVLDFVIASVTKILTRVLQDRRMVERSWYDHRGERRGSGVKSDTAARDVTVIDGGEIPKNRSRCVEYPPTIAFLRRTRWWRWEKVKRKNEDAHTQIILAVEWGVSMSTWTSDGQLQRRSWIVKIALELEWDDSDRGVSGVNTGWSCTWCLFF